MGATKDDIFFELVLKQSRKGILSAIIFGFEALLYTPADHPIGSRNFFIRYLLSVFEFVVCTLWSDGCAFCCSSVDAENMRLPLSVAFWRNGQPVSAGFGKYGDANTVG